ncbi:exosporium glycoprotein BclB-related protein [Paenibacillus yanchengensis]|uniref:exosporium glycoprotein BclB-related protein n=1 Tax=Paenibacillus yanchengensis TaxID=2035833 RepID=UPI003A901489
MIPFASGLPLALTTLVGGLAGSVGVVGFGSSGTTVLLAGNIIDLTSAGGTFINSAFVMPRNGVITGIAANFNVTVSLSLALGSFTIRATLYQATGTGTQFTQLAGTQVTLSPNIPGIVAIGAGTSGSLSNLNIPVASGTRLLLVFSAELNGLTVASAITGYANAGINII